MAIDLFLDLRAWLLEQRWFLLLIVILLVAGLLFALKWISNR